MADNKTKASEAEKAKEITNDRSQLSLREQLAGVDDEFKAKKGEQIEGLEHLDATDIKMPKLKIAQLTSKEVSDNKARPGQFYNPIADQAFDELYVSLLTMGKRRTMWPPSFKRGDLPLCFSTNGEIGTTLDGTRRSCANCEFQDWNKIPDGEKHPPCMPGYVWLGTTIGPEKYPFRIIVSGKSVSQTKNFLSELAFKQYASFVYNIRLYTVKESNDQGTYFVLKYEILGTIEKREEGLERRDLMNALADLFMQAMKNDATSADVAEEVKEAGIDGGTVSATGTGKDAF